MARNARALTLALACLAVAGCARDGAASGEKVLRFWGLGREGEVVKDLVPEFERENPGIRVVVQQIPWTAAHRSC
jgi:multiple sugar transport system substrate-binding protein